MSSFDEAGWLRRLWSLGSPGEPVTKHVQNVNLVNDRSQASSRERAPYAYVTTSLGAPGAGVHNFAEIRADDTLRSPLKLLHRARFAVNQGTSDAVVRVVLIAPGSFTTATRVAVTPIFRDRDADITLSAFSGTCTTANIPAASVLLPATRDTQITAATPTIRQLITELNPLGGLPFAGMWNEDLSLIFISAVENLAWTWDAAWQGIRD